MASEVKNDGKSVTIETSTPTPEGPFKSLTKIPILSSLKEMANIYLAVGAGGFILIVFLFIYVRNSTETSHLYQAATLQLQESQAEQIKSLIEELKDTRMQHRQDLEKATDRYIASRELNEKRHLELVAHLNRTTLFMEQLTTWFIKESRKPVGAIMSAPPPKPEM